jgi:ATP-dependent Clp protease adaptor protein ClpS
MNAQVERQEAAKTRHAPLYKVLVHNDPVTPEGVVFIVLIQVFSKDTGEALRIIDEVEAQGPKGVGLVAVLPLEVAELRVEQAHALSRARKCPLAFTIEPE